MKVSNDGREESGLFRDPLYSDECPGVSAVFTKWKCSKTSESFGEPSRIVVVHPRYTRRPLSVASALLSRKGELTLRRASWLLAIHKRKLGGTNKPLSEPERSASLSVQKRLGPCLAAAHSTARGVFKVHIDTNLLSLMCAFIVLSYFISFCLFANLPTGTNYRRRRVLDTTDKKIIRFYTRTRNAEDSDQSRQVVRSTHEPPRRLTFMFGGSLPAAFHISGHLRGAPV